METLCDLQAQVHLAGISSRWRSGVRGFPGYLPNMGRMNFSISAGWA
jgi:hypothetical protein